MKIKNVVLIGRGAVGAVYAAAFDDARSKVEGLNFRVAADCERRVRYESEPFIFNHKPYFFDYFTPHATHEKVDLVIIATKWGGYAAALDTIEPIVDRHTVILPLLNGLKAYDVARERFADSDVLRGFYLGHTASRGQNNETAQDGMYRTNFGQEINSTPYSPTVQSVAELFDAANIKYRVPEDMVAAAWGKFVINIGTNLPTGLYKYNYGELKNSPSAMELSVALMREAAAIATARQISGAEKLVDNALKTFDILQDEDYSSMAQDTVAGRETEIEIFAGEVIKMGRELHLPTPRTDEFYTTFRQRLEV
ncbi:MAG: 2-dehydropantoate 2-reductase [Mucinivorans sp.]